MRHQDGKEAEADKVTPMDMNASSFLGSFGSLVHKVDSSFLENVGCLQDSALMTPGDKEEKEKDQKSTVLDFLNRYHGDHWSSSLNSTAVKMNRKSNARDPQSTACIPSDIDSTRPTLIHHRPMISDSWASLVAATKNNFRSVESLFGEVVVPPCSCSSDDNRSRTSQQPSVGVMENLNHPNDQPSLVTTIGPPSNMNNDSLVKESSTVSGKTSSDNSSNTGSFGIENDDISFLKEGNHVNAAAAAAAEDSGDVLDDHEDVLDDAKEQKGDNKQLWLLKVFAFLVIMGAVVSMAIGAQKRIQENNKEINAWEGQPSAELSLSEVAPGKFDRYDWKELPLLVNTAATTLGYNADTWGNDHDSNVPIKCIFWSDMSSTKQTAAGYLGYDSFSWNERVFQDCVYEGWYDDFDWVDLPLEIQEAVTVMGYNQSLWDSDSETSVTNKDWVDLTQEEIDALGKLGWVAYWWTVI